MSFPRKMPAAVSNEMATRPKPRTIKVWGFRNTGPAIVAPMETPRSRVTTLAISFSEALTKRSATRLSRKRFPSIRVPINGVPMGAIKHVTRVTAMGKMIFKAGGTFFFWYFMTICRSSMEVNARMIGG